MANLAIQDFIIATLVLIGCEKLRANPGYHRGVVVCVLCFELLVLSAFALDVAAISTFDPNAGLLDEHYVPKLRLVAFAYPIVVLALVNSVLKSHDAR